MEMGWRTSLLAMALAQRQRFTSSKPPAALAKKALVKIANTRMSQHYFLMRTAMAMLICMWLVGVMNVLIMSDLWKIASTLMTARASSIASKRHCLL